VCPDCVPRFKCKACQKEILAGIVDLDGDKYHPECARCEICSEMLRDEYGIVRGVLRCKECMTASKPKVFKRTSRKKESVICVGCQQKVLAEFVFGDPEDTFHEECFRCAACGNQLDQFVVDNSGEKKRYLCGSCFYGEDGSDDEQPPNDESTAADVVEPVVVKSNSLQVPAASFQQMGKVNSFNMHKAASDASSFTSIGKKSCLKRTSNDVRSIALLAETDGCEFAKAESFTHKATKSVKFSDYDQMHEYKVKDNRSSYGSTLSSRASLETEDFTLVLNHQEPGCCERCSKRCTIS